jgi:16S rRNA (adenine1518-N6/adenine1519-N6)-dimethyltransferase
VINIMNGKKRASSQPLDAKALMRAYGIRPDKSLGQNFLIGIEALNQVVAAAELTGEETVLEIGAGLGALTRSLARSAYHVIAVEYDRRLLPVLEDVVGELNNVELVIGDILALDIENLIGERLYRVVANIPYNITSALIRRLMEAKHTADRLVLTLQWEVAQRIVAGPGALSLLALSVQIYGMPNIVANIPASAFYPQPKVNSAVLRVDIHDTPAVPQMLIPTIFQLARAGFSQKRKQLRNSLASGFGVKPILIEKWLEEAAISSRSRAQELSLDQWSRLPQTITEAGEVQRGK